MEDFRYRHEGGVNMVYTRYSSRAKGAFVLVHGVGMGRKVFEPLAQRLRPLGTVYAIDLPGFGASPKPERAATIPQTGDLVADFVRQMPEAAPVLIGHSMGTQVVAEAVGRHRDLPGRLARSAVLIAPTVNSAEKTVRQQALRMLQDLTGEEPIVLGKGMVEYAKAGIPWFMEKLRWMLDHDMEAAAARIPVRTLVLRGERDRVSPRGWARHVAALIPDSVYGEIAGHGHEAMIRDPRPAAALIAGFAERQEE